VGKPLTKWRMRQKVARLSESARTIGEVIVAYAPQAAQELGLLETPKPKRTAPRIAVGIVIGASGMCFLEPAGTRASRAGGPARQVTRRAPAFHGTRRVGIVRGLTAADQNKLVNNVPAALPAECAYCHASEPAVTAVGRNRKCHS